jgi:hypothetical protein
MEYPDLGYQGAEKNGIAQSVIGSQDQNAMDAVDRQSARFLQVAPQPAERSPKQSRNQPPSEPVHR